MDNLNNSENTISNKKLQKRKIIKITIYAILGIVVYFITSLSFEWIYNSTNNLIFYFLNFLLYNLPFVYLSLCFSDFILFIRRQTRKNKFDNSDGLKSIIFLSIILFCIIEAFYMPRGYSFTVVDYKKSSMLTYQYAILKDVIKGETTTVQVSDIDTGKISLHYKGRRTRRKIFYKVFVQ